MSCFSTPKNLESLREILQLYLRLPFSGDAVPGAILEAAIATIRLGHVLNTYDFVDVLREKERVGWQVKSTHDRTPVTWKRAKIPERSALIEQSRLSAAGCQKLGDTIIEFCNDHARESLEKYDLNEIGYCRLVVEKGGTALYFERKLCTRELPAIFNPADFEWRWSEPKATRRKEQLQALHGIHRASGEKWWAWHGLGENQLHFSGEGRWWPKPGEGHSMRFNIPSERMPLEELLNLLSSSLTVK